VITKAQIKFVKSLHLKKNRLTHQLFLVQGKKNIIELLNSSLSIEALYVTDSFAQEISSHEANYELVSQKEIEQMSSLKTNDAGIALVIIPSNAYLEASNDWVFVLDEVKDPGNLGTIARIADWYGVDKIICSNDSVDFYNPKVINASMGAFTRVDVYYTDLQNYFKNKNNLVFGAFLKGESVYDVKAPKEAYLLMGNESNGISDDLVEFVNHKVSIPRLGGAESLNVAIATAVICDNLIGRQF